MLWTHVKNSFHVPRCHSPYLSVSILEAKEIHKLTSGNDENTMRLLGHQLCHTELLQWNRLTVYRGNSSQLSSWKVLRSISGLHDMSILLKSTWIQTSQEYATHQSSTALNICSEAHQMKAKISNKEKLQNVPEFTKPTSVFSLNPYSTAFQT